MLFKWIFILFYVILIMTKICRPENNANNNNNIVSYSWIKSLKLLRSELKNCINDESIQSNKSTWGKCLKVTIQKIFDDIMSSHIITLMDGVKLVKISSQDGDGHNMDIDLLQQNYKKKHHTSTTARQKFMKSVEKSFDSSTWYENISYRITEILSKYVLQINILELDNTSDNIKNVTASARYRRHRHNLMLTMMFGVTAMGVIIVPIGFQLLSVLSGKALLLAKMALLLASINGLKRVAASGVHYGLYHVPDHYGGLYDRGEPNHQTLLQRNTKQLYNLH